MGNLSLLKVSFKYSNNRLCPCNREVRRRMRRKGEGSEVELVLTSKILLMVMWGAFFIYLYIVLLVKPGIFYGSFIGKGIKGPSASTTFRQYTSNEQDSTFNEWMANHWENMDLSHNWFSTLLHYFEQPRLNMVIVDLTTLASTLKYDDSFQDFLKVARLIMIMTGWNLSLTHLQLTRRKS